MDYNLENTTKIIEFIASVCHEVNAAYCKSIGDESQLSWDNAPEWQKRSALNGVLHILSNPNAPPSSSHESWMEQKIKDGWIYGETKDEVAKTHPCIVPYQDLPQEQKSKDYIFGAIVRSISNFKEE